MNTFEPFAYGDTRQLLPIPVAARLKAWFCGHWLAVMAGSNPAEAWISLVNVVCYQVEVSVTGRLLVSRSPTEGGVSEYDLETSAVVHRPTSAVEP